MAAMNDTGLCRELNGSLSRYLAAVDTCRAQRGMSLIEVLVALVIFSIGVLGMVGLQARATQFSVAAEDRTRAALLANELVAQMWAQGTTSLDASVTTPWRRRVENSGLLNAEPSVNPIDAQHAVIEIKWRVHSRRTSDDSSRYVTKVILP